MCHNFTQTPDSFKILDKRNGSETPLSYANNESGDWYLDENSNKLCYIGQIQVPTNLKTLYVNSLVSLVSGQVINRII